LYLHDTPIGDSALPGFVELSASRVHSNMQVDLRGSRITKTGFHYLLAHAQRLRFFADFD
jgi:hypothetical protein